MFALFRHILPLEVKACIISLTVALDHGCVEHDKNRKTVDLWYLLYLYDDEFHKYALTNTAKKKYMEYAMECDFDKGFNYMRTFSRLFGELHSINDLPAYEEMLNGELFIKEWHWQGRLYRENDKPTQVIYESKVLRWHKYDQPYRGDDKPSIIHPNEILWCNNGEYIRSNRELPERILQNQSSYVIGINNKMLLGNGTYNGAGAYNCPEFKEYFGVDWPYFGEK